MEQRNYVISERNADAEDYRKALWGLDYPASRDAIARKAADKGMVLTDIMLVKKTGGKSGTYLRE